MAIANLADAFGAAVRDMREELITKGFFGRNPMVGGTPDIEISAADVGALSPSIDSGWSLSCEHEHDQTDPAHDFDR